MSVFTCVDGSKFPTVESFVSFCGISMEFVEQSTVVNTYKIAFLMGVFDRPFVVGGVEGDILVIFWKKRVLLPNHVTFV